ncbi:unnamed protein product [Calicophoron daubneyi]|uniref:Nudix hydrolase domain-containing protein n=1 Tax=Calicophoron daubneyi TaxID=300641 RepID=A0AAV2TRE2_CALDB
MYARFATVWKFASLFIFCSVFLRFFLYSFSRMSAATSLHKKCRNAAYPRADGLQRALVPDEKVDWRVKWDEYDPVNYTHPKVFGKEWADPDIRKNRDAVLLFNEIDGKVDRTSFMGPYQIDAEGLPLNPRGRTGIRGRGALGRWGPNHAADPIVTRWKTNENGERVFDPEARKFVLQFVAIQRGDCGEWAIPGGMVDCGEKCTETVKREFSEEALDSTQASPEERAAMKVLVDAFFRGGDEVYQGYVDDPRNTDNAWMETAAINFHDDSGDSVAKFDLKAGDDAKKICWMDVSQELKLYASHRDFLELVAKRRNAKW